MDPPDLLGSGEVRNRPRDSQNPMEAARGKPHRCSSIGKELATSSGVADFSSTSPSASAFVRTPDPL